MSYMAAVDVAPSVAMGMSQVRTQAIRLFAVGFLVLFMELACIRWFATYVIFLQFFTNVILIASFLGMSCGCLAAGRRQEWLHYFPLIGLGAIVAALALLKAPPAVWFLICCAGIAYLLYQERALDGLKITALVTLVVLVSMPGDWLRNDGHVRHWSPYYMVDHETATGFIKVNAIGHQQMAPFSAGAAVYSLIHLLQQHSGGKPFEDMIAICAG